MSEQYLSQDEIDALLDTPQGDAADAAATAADGADASGDSGAAAGTVDGAASGEAAEAAEAAGDGAGSPAGAMGRPADRGVPQPYDLARQERIIRGRLPALELIHERFARSMGLAMFAFMQRNPEITASEPVVGRYSDFLATVENPSSINIMQTKPLAGSALLVFQGQLVSTIVDLMFGGSGRPVKKSEGREFSQTEQRLIRKLINLARTEYGRAWAPLMPFEMEFARAETQPQFANIAIPAEMVVSTTFTLDFGGKSGTMQVCIPYSVLEPVRNTLASSLNTQGTGEKRSWQGQMSQEIRPAGVQLVAELTTATLTLGELMRLQTGDVIEIEPGPQATLKIGQVPIFSGRYGEHNGRYAVRIDTVNAYTDLPQD